MFDVISLDSNQPPYSIVEEQIAYKNENGRWDIPLHEIANEHLYNFSDSELDLNWCLNEFFGTLAVINLPQSKQRLKSITMELQNVGITSFEVFRAIDGRQEVSPDIWKKFQSNREHYDLNIKQGLLALDQLHQGEAGCYLSHYNLIKKTNIAFQESLKQLQAAQATQNDELISKATIQVRKYSRLFIMEDDAGFGIVNKSKTCVNKVGVGKILRQALSELPENWDMLYFLVKSTQPTDKLSSHLRKLRNSWGAVAYAINSPFYETLLLELEKIEDPEVSHVLPLDMVYSSIHEFHNVYAIFPSIVFHHAGVSEISSRRHKKLLQTQP